MDWGLWFGWPFQLSVCAAAILTLAYVVMRWRKMHPFWVLVVIHLTGLGWSLVWFACSIVIHQWLSVAVWSLIIGWFVYKGREVWDRRDTRHVPYP